MEALVAVSTCFLRERLDASGDTPDAFEVVAEDDVEYV